MSKYRKLLVPHDFSECSRAALGLAVELAKTLGAKLHLLHVYQRPVELFSPYGVSLPEGVVREICEGAEKRLAAERKTLEKAGVADGAEVREGVPARVISETAAEIGADLIVMGTHGHTGGAHLLIGSVAERTLREAPCPVLTVKAGAK